LVLRNINIRCQKIQPTVTRQINETTIAQFKLHLSEENWSNTFNEEDMESSFNNFLNEYLRIFNHSFPLKKYYNKHTKQGWLTKGIKIPCQHKRDLYMLCKDTNNS
jgi:ribosomal protein S4